MLPLSNKKKTGNQLCTLCWQSNYFWFIIIIIIIIIIYEKIVTAILFDYCDKQFNLGTEPSIGYHLKMFYLTFDDIKHSKLKCTTNLHITETFILTSFSLVIWYMYNIKTGMGLSGMEK